MCYSPSTNNQLEEGNIMIKFIYLFIYFILFLKRVPYLH